jgi:DNA-binding transcriptional LysR family regulator
MLEGVLEGRLAAAVFDGPLSHPALEGVEAFKQQMVVIAPGSFPFIGRSADVAGEAIYAFRANCSYRRHFESWFAHEGITPGRIVEIESYHSILACVIAGAE